MADDTELVLSNVTGGNAYNFTFPGDATFTLYNTTPFVDPNSSDSTTTVQEHPVSGYTIWQQVLILTLMIILMIGTIIGNSLVCIAVGIVKRLQSPSNLLIVSLALSDLLVAVFVMPLSAVHVILRYWPFSDIICDLWTSSDVIMCTASILNLCMISVDRYFVITRPFQYAMKRTPKRMFLMIGAVWTLAIVISVPPLFIGTGVTERKKGECIINQSKAYQIYATLGAFYVPLIVMIFIYFRIWKISNNIMKKESKSKMGSIDRGNETITLSRGSGASEHLPNGNFRNGFTDSDDPRSEMLQKPRNSRYNIKSFIFRSTRRGARGSGGSGGSHSASNKERKAIKTLGIIMGGFTLCWLPFFIVAVSAPFLHKDTFPLELTICFTWLGYFNSFMNPLIYARFNREFRSPFKEILCFRCNNINNRLRSESYVEQYGPDHIYRDRDRDTLRPPADTIVRYHSQDQTQVHIGNGNTRSIGESNL